MGQWNMLDFDWTIGQYKTTQVVCSYYVDSTYGLDTNAGTKTAPFKTIQTALTLLNNAGVGSTGAKIGLNGIFSENITANYAYEFIGFGGGKNGRTVFDYNIPNNTCISLTISNTKIRNIVTTNYTTAKQLISLPYTSGVGYTIYTENCLLKNCIINTNYHGNASPSSITSYYTIFYNIQFFVYNSSSSSKLYGKNNTYYNCSVGIGLYYSYTSLSHYNNALAYVYYGNYNIVNVDGLYIDPVNDNFNLQSTSPLIATGNTNEMTGVRPNVGAGILGVKQTGLSSSMTVAGGAILTNVTPDVNGIFSITTGNEGTIESGTIDLGSNVPLTQLNFSNYFASSVGKLTQFISSLFSRALGTAQGGDATSVILSDTAYLSAVNDYYKNMELRMVESGSTQIRDILGYNASTKTIVISGADLSPVPTASSTYEIFEKGRTTINCQIKYGLTFDELSTCPWLTVEYGKRPSYSGTGLNRIGNADLTFDIATQTFITSTRFIKVKLQLKKIV